VAFVAAADEQTCAITTDHALWCWGHFAANTLTGPVEIRALGKTVAGVAVGDRRVCAYSMDGALSCWGPNEAGELGDGTTVDRALPTPVVGLDHGVTEVSIGYEHTCARKSDGSVWCWGSNQFGQLGDGTDKSSNVPVRVTGSWP
jgi:alpha-tubulin suppressor-like RCC1 family protein